MPEWGGENDIEVEGDCGGRWVWMRKERVGSADAVLLWNGFVCSPASTARNARGWSERVEIV